MPARPTRPSMAFSTAHTYNTSLLSFLGQETDCHALSGLVKTQGPPKSDDPNETDETEGCKREYFWYACCPFI